MQDGNFEHGAPADPLGSDPDYAALNHDPDLLEQWLLAAERGSLEEVILAALCSYSDDRACNEVAHFVHCRRAWEGVRSFIDPTRHRRSGDLELRLPFPLSQALVCFPIAGACHPDLREDGARIAAEILASFPDEDSRVVMTVETTRAELLLIAGHEEAHFLFERLMREYTHDWLPVAKYCAALGLPRGHGSSVARWRRVRQVVERALREPEKDYARVAGWWDPDEMLWHAEQALAETP